MKSVRKENAMTMQGFIIGMIGLTVLVTLAHWISKCEDK